MEQHKLPQAQFQEFTSTLNLRFQNNMKRHQSIVWEDVLHQLERNPHIAQSVLRMEQTGGEPDVVMFKNSHTGVYYVDCSLESPTGRRNLCFDNEALVARKTAKPKGSAVETAIEIGMALLTESQYELLQTFGPFDTTTSSWLDTPKEIRAKGGALYGDYRYGRTFIYHNGAQSYYAARGFRGILPLPIAG